MVSVLGATSHATQVLMPALKAAGVRLRLVSAQSGHRAAYAARRFGCEEAVTDADRVFSDPETNAVVIATRHDSHARFVIETLGRGKHVYVEKPLCMTVWELEAVQEAAEAARSAGQPAVRAPCPENERRMPRV